VLDAFITDFDGVMVDSEPLHFRGFAEILAAENIKLTWEAYSSTYLSLDDHDCLQAVAADQGRDLTEEQIESMTEAKSRLMLELMAEDIRAFPGVEALLAAMTGADVPMAICSGCLRAEVELCSRTLGIWDVFQTAVTARDVTHGKPHPEGYTKALTQLREITGRDIQADRCVVAEDSPGGVASAKDAGMKVVGVTNSYPADALTQADRIVDSLEGITPAMLSEWFGL
jgi:beta-phosphoglucomutase